MERLYIEATKSSPRIEFDAGKGVLEIEGQSYPENARAFYKPVLQWVQDFLEFAEKPFEVNVRIIYLNTSSSKAMMILFDMFEDAFQKGKKLSINWYYDPENDMAKECGEEFCEDLSIPFNIIEEIIEDDEEYDEES